MQSLHYMMTHYWLVKGHGCNLPVIATVVSNVPAVTFSLGHFDPLTILSQHAVTLYTILWMQDWVCAAPYVTVRWQF